MFSATELGINQPPSFLSLALPYGPVLHGNQGPSTDKMCVPIVLYTYEEKLRACYYMVDSTGLFQVSAL